MGPLAPLALAQGIAMMNSMTTTPAPLVSREALRAFTRQLVECYAPEKVILYSCGESFGYW